MNRAVIGALIVMAATLSSADCFGSRIPNNSTQPDRPSTTLTAADSNYVREMSAVMKIIAPDIWRDSLSHLAGVGDLRAAIDAYFALRDFETRPDTPRRNEWREDIERRLAWCRANLSTPIDARIPDVRWELVLRNGVPTAAWRSTATRFIGFRGPYQTTVYNMVWRASGLAVACELSDLGDLAIGYEPIRDFGWITDAGEAIQITPEDYADMARQTAIAQAEINEPSRFVAFPGLKKIIHANVSSYVFPNEDGTSDLWVAALTRGDQFTDSTLSGDRLELQLSVYDASISLAAEDRRYVTGLRELIESDQARRLAIPAYLSCKGLAPGRYEFALSIQGESPANLGVYRDTVTIPPRRSLRGASDVIVAFAAGAINGTGITRRGAQIPADPSGVHQRNDSLSLYVEFPQAEIPGDKFRVTISLIPKSNPFATWRRSRDRERTLFSSVIDRVELGGRFQGTVVLEDVKSGQYFLAIQVASQLIDPEGEDPVMSWTDIEVK